MKERPLIDLGMTGYDELFYERYGAPGGDASEKYITSRFRRSTTSQPIHFRFVWMRTWISLWRASRNEALLPPITLRQKADGRYEIVSGHRRRKACELAGLATVPAEIKELTRDEAIILMVESNLQRSTILPSEKAFSYKMRLEAMKRQAGRPSKDNLGPVVQNFSRDELGESAGESGRQISRYIRLTELIPDLLTMVDEGRIALRPAVELSYLDKLEQQDLAAAIGLSLATPSHAQAIKLRAFSKEGKLSPAVIESIMCEEKPNQKEKINIKYTEARKYIPSSVPYEQTGAYILKALEYYHRHLERQRGDAR